MSKNKKSRKEGYTFTNAAGYSFGQVSLITANQSFSFLVFTFYFAVIRINVNLISIGFLLWSIWNAFNDPLIGYISDKTHTKWGRRRPYIMIGLVPLALAMFFLFSPPRAFGLANESGNFVYFIVIILIFELCYTIYDINLTSLFPELFITKEDRMKANNVRQVFAILGLIFAYVLPGLFISDYSAEESLPQYQIFGITITIIIIIVGIIFLKFSPKERVEFQQEYQTMPNFVQSFKLCLKNKSFRWFIPAVMANMYVNLMLTTIVPLYGKFVLDIGEGETLFLSLMLGLSFISAAIFITILWKPLTKKIGLRKGWMLSSLLWLISLIPFLFLQERWFGLIAFTFVGVGIAGGLYFPDITLSDIIDEDEVIHGTRREASFFGFYIFFLRITNIFVYFSISLVFSYAGWGDFDPILGTTEAVILGLRILAFVFPAIALAIIILMMYKFPLDKEQLDIIKEKLEEIHQEKKSRVTG
ncbi:MAG: MFS transporter [Candidatus Thorarchaeota archaeon]